MAEEGGVVFNQMARWGVVFNQKVMEWRRERMLILTRPTS